MGPIPDLQVPLSHISRARTHRLIPTKFRDGGDSVLVDLAEDEKHLGEIFELDNATNERLHAEENRLPGISSRELVFGIPNYRVINAAFTHPNPLGARFSSPERGAWYAAFELRTAQAEVLFHKSIEFIEIGWSEPETVRYDDYLAAFDADFHDLRPVSAQDELFAAYLDPSSYVHSQQLAERLLAAGSHGIVYPSVRRRAGTCIGCFQPALIHNVRRDRSYALEWSGVRAVFRSDFPLGSRKDTGPG